MAVKTKPETPAAAVMSANGAGHRAVVPPPGPQVRKRERPRRGLIATGVVVLLVSVLGAALVYQREGGKVSVIKVAKAVPVGHKIEPGDLTTAQMASNDIPAYGASHMSELYGKVAEVGLVPGDCVQLRAGDSLIDLVSVDGQLGRMGGAAPGAEGRNLDHLCLRVSPFDREAIVAHLRARAVRVGDHGSRYGAEGEGPSQYLFDPEGNMIELKGPPDAPAHAMAADAGDGRTP